MSENSIQLNDDAVTGAYEQLAELLNEERHASEEKQQSEEKDTPKTKAITVNKAKRGREETVSRSRAEIVQWVLSSEDLIRDCVCPYCLKIHSRRDNNRVHMKTQHRGEPIREFVINVDATLDEVRRVNEVVKVHRLNDTKRSRLSPENNDYGEFAEDNSFAMFNMENPLSNFLMKFEQRANEEELKTEKEGDRLNGTRDQTPFAPVNDTRASTSSSSMDHVRSPKGPSFGCVICPCSFDKIQELETHVSQIHRTFYRCNVCLAEFVKPDHLKHHFNSTHQ